MKPLQGIVAQNERELKTSLMRTIWKEIGMLERKEAPNSNVRADIKGMKWLVFFSYRVKQKN